MPLGHESPFSFGKIAVGSAFTDREQDKKRLSQNISSRVNTVLISPRRWGKSSLVAAVGRELVKADPSFRFVFIDLFNIRSEQEFYAVLTREVLRASTSRWEELVESIQRFFKHISPTIQVGTDPLNDFALSFNWEEAKRTPSEILDLADRVSEEKGLRIVVCLDEFQNISLFDDPAGFQRTLRAHLQHHQYASYCMYGSKRHLMSELFERRSMPFYKFGDVMFLEKIPEQYWVPFIISGFESTGRSISEPLAARIARTMEEHPYFVQQYAHEVWSQTSGQCTDTIVDNALDSLLSHHTMIFQREVENLTNPQVSFLKALCDGVAHFSSAETVAQYRLGTSANVVRIKQALVTKEVLDITPRGVAFIDPLFKQWFLKAYMKP